MRTLTHVLCCVMAICASVLGGANMSTTKPEGRKPLPPADVSGKMPFEQTIAMRRSIRDFAAKTLTTEQIGQLCWAGQGITDPATGYRAAPSAGALYPIELYLVTGEGVYHYRPREHALETHLADDVRRPLQRASIDQGSVGEAPLTVAIAAVVDRAARKYRARAERYCFIEAGHVAQNMLLQATALGLGGVPVGAFDDDQVAGVLRLPKDTRVLYLLPMGYPRGGAQ